MFQFRQADYLPRHSSVFKTVFGIMIRPLSFCKIIKMWGTNKHKTKKQRQVENFNIHNRVCNKVTTLFKFFFHLLVKFFLFCRTWSSRSNSWKPLKINLQSGFGSFLSLIRRMLVLRTQIEKINNGTKNKWQKDTNKHIKNKQTIKSKYNQTEK